MNSSMSAIMHLAKRFVRMSLRYKLLTAAVPVITVAIWGAQAQAQPFSQCPAIGLDGSCGVLITVNPGACSTVITPDPSQGPYEGADDTLTGIQNNSGSPLCSIALSQPPATCVAGCIFAFDGDGICSSSISPQPSGCPFGTTLYEGPGVTYNASSASSGTVNFSPCIPSGGSAYFALEEALTAVGACNGNGVCDAPCGETCANCPADCGPCNCGDGRCDPGEDTTTCPADCHPPCGNHVCDSGETCANCTADCGLCTCGNGTCDPGEACDNCAQDCGQCRCGDGTCQVGETCSSCPQDCGSCCGNGTCDTGETCSSCPQDCGSCCGNGTCDTGETCSSCPQDCGSCCGNGTCDTGETCSSCPQDCGSCSSQCSAFPCGTNGTKQTICHIPPGNPGSPRTLCVAQDAVPAHVMNHGDHCGPCQ